MGSPDQRLVVTAPPRAGRNPVLIEAEVVPGTNAQVAAPAYLVLALDGGHLHDDAGLPVTRLEATTTRLRYRAVAAFPAVEGPHQVFAVLPDGRLGGSATTLVDLSPPRLAIQIVPPDDRATSNDGGLNERDVGAPGAFRRDETLRLRIDSPERLGSSTEVDLISDGGSRTFAADAGCLSSFSGGACVQATIDLWRHPMRAYQENIGLVVRIADELGNTGTFDAGHATITRFKWTRDAPSGLWSLALTRDGLLAFHASTPSPRLIAWAADGRDLWSQPSTGEAGFVTVGTNTSEHIYTVSVDPQTGMLETSATPTATPAQVIAPLVPRIPSGGIAHPMILGDPTQEVAWFPSVVSRVTLQAWRLQDRLATSALDAGTISGGWFGGPITDNGRIFIPGYSSIRSTELSVVVTDPSGTLAMLPPRLVIDGGVFNGAVAQTNLVYLGVNTTDGGVLMTATQTAVTQVIPLPMRIPSVIIGTNHVFVNEVGAAGPGQTTLCRLPLSSTNITCGSARTRGSPILGAATSAGGSPVLYVQGYDSALEVSLRAVDSESLTTLWELSTPYVYMPTSIDCSRFGTVPRPGVPGVLYSLASTDPTRIMATIVDSPGIDGTARWPMITHDPRNTMNSQMPLSPFYCP